MYANIKLPFSSDPVGHIQANLAIVNLDIMKTWLYGRDLSDRSCTQVKYLGYSETNQYNESEENAVSNKLNHSETGGALHLTTK